MGVPLPWITEWDLMAGLDKHNELCIPPTPPAPPAPSLMHKHFVFGAMHWAANSGTWKKQDVHIENRLACKHFHDISYFIPHVPAPLPGWVLLPAIIPLSGSKIAIGCFTVHRNDEPAGAWGPTLNCWSGFPRPSGVIIPTRLPSVWVGIGFLDLLFSVLIVGFDMLLSYLLNKAFDNWLKGRVEKIVGKALSAVAGKVLTAEIAAAVNQAINKVVTEISKKLFGKVLKEGAKFIQKTVEGWFGRTNPGMQEKYIKVFEAEAPALFTRWLYDTFVPEIRAEAAEAFRREFPELDPATPDAADPSELPYEEFEKTVGAAIGPMIQDAVRGLLSGDEWEKLLRKDEPAEGGPDAEPGTP